jgi:hypothetical protein
LSLVEIAPAGYASSSEGPTHFGLGASKTADLVEIHWPSGTVQELKNLPADRTVRIRGPRQSGAAFHAAMTPFMGHVFSALKN